MQRDSERLRGLWVKRLKRAKRTRFNALRLRRFDAFALYEVLLGVAIFAVGVIALGRMVENCLNASTISAEESAVRQILSDRMAEIQAAPVVPDAGKELRSPAVMAW